MKAEFSFLKENDKSPVANPFDAMKFARLIRYKESNEKEQRHWLHRFFHGKTETTASSSTEAYKTNSSFH